MKAIHGVPSLLMVGLLISACQPPRYTTTAVPAQEYAERLRGQYAAQGQPYSGQSDRVGDFRSVATVIQAEGRDTQRARLRFAADGGSPEITEPVFEADAASDPASVQGEPGFIMKRSSMQNRRDYVGPLTLGDPGVTASLWQESRSSANLFHDTRAWQPMDVLTIVVSEQAEGKNNANTEIKEKSTVEAAIENLLGIETDLEKLGNRISTGTATANPAISASTQNDFKGEGKTDRKGSLKGRISAMVVEVLPSGVLRIEGEKIVSVNSEQQIMKISGLVRTRDVSADNEVDSSRIAQLRVDYYGEGTVGEAQNGGWLGRVLRKVWPF